MVSLSCFIAMRSGCSVPLDLDQGRYLGNSDPQQLGNLPGGIFLGRLSMCQCSYEHSSFISPKGCQSFLSWATFIPEPAQQPSLSFLLSQVPILPASQHVAVESSRKMFPAVLEFSISR